MARTRYVESMKTIVIRLTPLEAEMLQYVVGNGWGDGDFAGWLDNKQHAAACRRAMKKLDAARRKPHN